MPATSTSKPSTRCGTLLLQDLNAELAQASTQAAGPAATHKADTRDQADEAAVTFWWQQPASNASAACMHRRDSTQRLQTGGSGICAECRQRRPASPPEPAPDTEGGPGEVPRCPACGAPMPPAATCAQDQAATDAKDASHGGSSAEAHHRKARAQALAAQRTARRRFARRLLLCGELLAILRPLIYVALLRRWGRRSWIPWLGSLAAELLSRAVTLRAHTLLAQVRIILCTCAPCRLRRVGNPFAHARSYLYRLASSGQLTWATLICSTLP